MIKTAKMQGNMMVSARGARGCCRGVGRTSARSREVCGGLSSLVLTGWQ